MFKFKVNIIESERGWGQKIDQVKEFDSVEEAEQFISEFNKKHCTQAVAPDWYMMAERANYTV